MAELMKIHGEEKSLLQAKSLTMEEQLKALNRQITDLGKRLESKSRVQTLYAFEFDHDFIAKLY
jgi:hypothetical protein